MRVEVPKKDVPRTRLHWYASGCMITKRMRGHLRLNRGGEDEGETGLPEWLKGEDGTARVYNNTPSSVGPSLRSASFSRFVWFFFVLWVSVQYRSPGMGGR